MLASNWGVSNKSQNLSKFVLSEGVPRDSKWSAHISRILFLSVKILPSTRKALICEVNR